MGLLGKLDYLSTVSGGGYTGGWFTSWLHRDGRDEVLAGIDPAQVGAMRGEAANALAREPPPRDVPLSRAERGVISADVWTLLATMARNLVLNWLVLLPLLAAVLLVPRIYLATVANVEQNVIAAPGQACLPADAAPFWFGLLSLSMFVVAIGYVVMNFVGRGDSWPQGRFLSFVVGPTVIGTIGLTLFWSAYPCAPDETAALFVSAVLPAAGWLVIGAIARPNVRTAPPALAAAALTAAALVTAGGWTPGGPWRIELVAGVPLMLIAVAALNQRLDRRALSRIARCG